MVLFWPQVEANWGRLGRCHTVPPWSLETFPLAQNHHHMNFSHSWKLHPGWTQHSLGTDFHPLGRSKPTGCMSWMCWHPWAARCAIWPRSGSHHASAAPALALSYAASQEQLFITAFPPESMGNNTLSLLLFPARCAPEKQE